MADERRYADAADAARLRDALGVALPQGLPIAYTDPVADPLADLVSRFGRTHGPFLTAHVARRFGVAAERVIPVLDRLEASGRVVRGEFRPDGVEREWCDSDVLRQLRRRSLAALRSEVEPVDSAALARFLPAWQGVGVPRRGLDALVEVIGVLQGAALPVSVLESDVLPARLASYSSADLDALCSAGEVVWVGAGSLGRTDGRIRLLFRDQAASLIPASAPAAEPPEGAVHDALRTQLADRGASFWPDLVAAAHRAGQPYDDATVLAALWDLVWSGEVTNDSLAPVRGLVGARLVASSHEPPAGSRSAGAAVGGGALVARRTVARTRGHRHRSRARAGVAVARTVRRAHARGGSG